MNCPSVVSPRAGERRARDRPRRRAAECRSAGGELRRRCRALGADGAARHVVLTLVGNRQSGCWRSWPAPPRPRRLRATIARPRTRPAACVACHVVVCDEPTPIPGRRAGTGDLWAPWSCRTRAVPPAVTGADDPCLITFTSVTAGEPKGCCTGSATCRSDLQARPGSTPGRPGWVPAASVCRSRPARVSRPSPARLPSARRRSTPTSVRAARRERVDLLAWRDRVPRRSPSSRTPPGLMDLRGAVAAGEALNPQVLDAAHAQVWTATATADRTAAAVCAGDPRPPVSMVIPLLAWARRLQRGSSSRPATIQTFFLRYLGDEPPPWRGDGDRGRATTTVPALRLRTDDGSSRRVRIGPFDVDRRWSRTSRRERRSWPRGRGARSVGCRGVCGTATSRPATSRASGRHVKERRAVQYPGRRFRRWAAENGERQSGRRFTRRP